MLSRDPSAGAGSQPTKNRWVLVMLGLVLFAAYSNSFHAPFLFDDTPTILENATLRSFRTALFPPSGSGLTVSGRPILNLSLAINYALGRESVTGYHVVNLGIHFLAALALFGLVRRTLQLPRWNGRYGEEAWKFALAVAAVWALHPLQTESVTYVVQRAESLVGLFYLLTLYAFVRSLTAPARASSGWRAMAIGACLLGMGTKEVMVSAPLITFLFDRTFVSGSFREAWRVRGRFYLALAATWLLLGWCIWSTGGRGGTVGFSGEMPWWRYALTQGYAIPHYLRLTLWPRPLVFDYGDSFTPGRAEMVVGAMALVALAGGTLWALWRKPVIGFLGVAFFAVLAPSSSVVPILTQTIAEHRMYLALAPVVVALVLGTAQPSGRWGLIGWFMVAGLLGVITYQRNFDYRSVEVMATDTVNKQPRNARAWCTLAMSLCTRGELAAAKAAVETAMKVAPDTVEVLINYANVLSKTGDRPGAVAIYRNALERIPQLYDAHYNLGVLLSEMGETDAAIAHLRSAVALRPGAGFAHYNLGNALVSARRAEEAIPHFELALADQPTAPEVRNNLANALLGLGRPQAALPILETGLKQTPASADLRGALGLSLLALGRTTEATREFANVVQQSPDSSKAQANLGLALMSAGKTAEACEHYEIALRLGKNANPRVDLALHVSLAEALSELGETARALQHYRQALALEPENEQIRYHLAHRLLQSGDAAAAAQNYEELVQKHPSFVEAHNDLGLAYAQMGRRDAAREQFELALRLRPDDPAARANLAALAAASQR